MKNIASIRNWAFQNWYIPPLIAFLIPLAVRAIPEILMGPYIVGFDTMGFYVPNTLLWLHNGANLGAFLATAPLFYSILMALVAIGGSPVYVLKVISPILLGLLSLSMYAYAKRGLDWSSAKSVFVAFLGALYFVALRTSWDQLREELGLVFLFVVLIMLSKRKYGSWKHLVILFACMLVVVLSHQLISVLMFGIVVFTIAHNVMRKDFPGSISLTVASLPAFLYFFIVYLSDVLNIGLLNYSTNVGSPLANWMGFVSYPSMLLSAGGFFLYCYLPILPIALVSLWRFRNLQLGSWIFLSLILMVVPIASVSPYRWVLLLTYPLAFCATNSISKLKSIRWNRLNVSIQRIVVLYLILSTALLSFGYIASVPERPFTYFNPVYFNKYANEIPTSMLQNTISITDLRDTTSALQWFRNSVNSSSVLLTHIVFYSWALLVLNETQVVNYGFDPPENAALIASQGGHSEIYVIWWINGQGWYSQPTITSLFQEVYHSGKIAIYRYIPVT